MRDLGRINRPYVYIVIGLVLILAIGLLELFKFLDVDIIDITGLRFLAISLSTIAGILIGLVAASIASIVRVSIAQKQFYQGILAGECQWLKDWFSRHADVVRQIGKETKDVLYLLYRHSTIAAVSDDELLGKISNTLLPLPDKWRELHNTEMARQRYLEQEEVDEFEVHLDGVGATVGQIKASKDRMQVGQQLGDVLWTLGSVLLIGLIVILLCSLPGPPDFLIETASELALILIEIASVSVFFIIYIVTRYLRAEVKEITRVV